MKMIIHGKQASDVLSVSCNVAAALDPPPWLQTSSPSSIRTEQCDKHFAGILLPWKPETVDNAYECDLNSCSDKRPVLLFKHVGSSPIQNT